MSQTPGDKKNPPTRLARGLESLLSPNAKSTEDSPQKTDASVTGSGANAEVGLPFEAPHPALPGAAKTVRTQSPATHETSVAAASSGSKSASNTASEHTERVLQLALRSAEISQQHAREAGMELQRLRWQLRWLLALLAVVIFVCVFGAWWSGWVVGQHRQLIEEHVMEPAVSPAPANWETEKAKLLSELRDTRAALEAANVTMDELANPRKKNR